MYLEAHAQARFMSMLIIKTVLTSKPAATHIFPFGTGK